MLKHVYLYKSNIYLRLSPHFHPSRSTILASRVIFLDTRAALSRSKVGAAQVRLKVGLVSDEAGHNFTFTSPQATALAERDKFEAELTTIIAHNRSGGAVPPPLSAAALQPAAKAIPPHVAAATPGPGSPGRPLPPLSRASTSRAASVVSDSRGSGTPVNDPTNDFRLRKKVLLATPELAQLHRELVMGGHITESEFWEGREVSMVYVFGLSGSEVCALAVSTSF